MSFRGNTSSDLMDVADLFTDITQIAKVEKGSSRSGRRVAADDADLSMTEVPDKQSEGTGERSRGRGRTRRTTGRGDAPPRASRGRGRVAPLPRPARGRSSPCPGEKLSRAPRPPRSGPRTGDLDEAVAELEGGETPAPSQGENGMSEDGPPPPPPARRPRSWPRPRPRGRRSRARGRADRVAATRARRRGRRGRGAGAGAPSGIGLRVRVGFADRDLRDSRRAARR